MPFPYYHNLSEHKKRIYNKSDSFKSIPFNNVEKAKGITKKLKINLEKSTTSEINNTVSELSDLICKELQIIPVTVKIKTKRPSNSREELQGLYEMSEDKFCSITIWMKTSQKGQTVAFKTFLRTVLHELIHHLDYFYFKLADSLHTEGFFIRESNLFKDIVDPELLTKPKRISTKTPASMPKPTKTDNQLTLSF